MAHDFFGSRNNINLLKFNLGDNDISLNPITRFIFRKEDDNLLEYLIEDGKVVAPKWFIPIIPMVLVNGSEGGDEGIPGWSSYVPSYNPREIIANVKRLLNGEKSVPMVPWYKGFRGTIEKSAKEGEYIVNGTVVDIDEQTFRITELPIGTSIQDYKEFLESIADGSPNVKNPLVEDFKLNGDGAIVDIEIRMKPDKIALIMKEGLLKKFKLTTTISTNNMYLLDTEGKIKKFDTPEQIMEEIFFPLRLEYYGKRKAYILANQERLLLKLDNIVRFIFLVNSGDIIVTNRKIADLLMELKQRGFAAMPRKGNNKEQEAGPQNEVTWGDDEYQLSMPIKTLTLEGFQKLRAEIDEKVKDNNSEAHEDDNSKDYEYLLSLPIGTLTIQSFEKLLAQKKEKEKQFDIFKATPITSLWMADLDELEKMLDEIDSKEAEEEIQRSSQAGKKTANGFATKPGIDNTSMEGENVVEVTKPKGRAGFTKTQKDSADDDTLPLQERLAACNFESSSEKTRAMETEEPTLPASHSDDDFKVVQKTAPEAGKKK